MSKIEGSSSFPEKSGRGKDSNERSSRTGSAQRNTGDRDGAGKRKYEKPAARKSYDRKDKDSGFKKERPSYKDEKPSGEGVAARRSDKRSFSPKDRSKEAKKPFSRTDNTEKKPWADRKASGAEGEKRPYRGKAEGTEGSRKPYDKPGAKPWKDRKSDSTGGGDKKPWKEHRTDDRAGTDGAQKRPYERRKPAEDGETRGFRGERKPFEKRPARAADKKPYERRKPAESAGDEKEHGFEQPANKARRAKDRDESERKDWVPVGKKEDKPISGPMTLNKYISHSGEASRREAAEFVKQGKVRVNGELVLEPGYRIVPGDQVTLSGKKLTPQKGLVYVLLNKPKGYITTTEDPEERKTVMDLVTGVEAERLFPVGRLDRNTTGLLLLTNDGTLAHKLSHPSFNIRKVYKVTLDKNLTRADYEKIVKGPELEDGKVQVDELAYLDTRHELGIEIHSGRNRIVRRIFESLGYSVEKLDRVMYAGLTKKNLPRGKWRLLDEREVVLLKHFK